MATRRDPPRESDGVRARVERRADFLALLLVLAGAAALLVPPLGQRVISTSHEARFAVLAEDMVKRSAWLEARVGGEVYRNKPPLFPWSIAVLSLPRGSVTEATAQAPTTLAALATVFLTFLLGRALWGRRAGLWAALILVTTYDFFAYSQLILPDMLVVAFFAAAAWTFWRAVSGPPRPWALVGFYAALALGVFAKGPVGLLPLLVAAAWLLWSFSASAARARARYFPASMRLPVLSSICLRSAGHWNARAGPARKPTAASAIRRCLMAVHLLFSTRLGPQLSTWAAALCGLVKK